MSNTKLAQVFHFDLYGKREYKYDFLSQNALGTITWNKLQPALPNLFFVNKNFDELKEYEKGFGINELFTLNNVGIVTARDEFTIHNTKEDVENTITEFLKLDDEAARSKFNLGKDVRDWQVNFAKKDLQTHYPNKGNFVKIAYRPFDERWTYYTGKSKGFHCYPRNEVMQHFINGDNLGLVLEKIMMNKSVEYRDVFITSNVYDAHLIGSASYSFPLYLYPENNTQQSIEQSTERTVNFNMPIIEKIEKELNVCFVEDDNWVVDLAAGWDGTFYPTNVVDYIYAVLHSPTYREKYKEFLKIDFPRVPYPKNVKTFWQLVNLGRQLREIHLLQSPLVENYITQYPVDGNNVVSKISFALQDYDAPPEGDNENYYTAVYINDTQFFGNVPLEAWQFYIGGYQPAQKWLKDRKGKALSFEDILHYQKIIVALTETDRLMKEIDAIEI